MRTNNLTTSYCTTNLILKSVHHYIHFCIVTILQCLKQDDEKDIARKKRNAERKRKGRADRTLEKVAADKAAAALRKTIRIGIETPEESSARKEEARERQNLRRVRIDGDHQAFGTAASIVVDLQVTTMRFFWCGFKYVVDYHLLVLRRLYLTIPNRPSLHL
jgi:hypothetical protein